MYEAEEKNMIDIVHYISNWCPQEGIYENKIVIYDDTRINNVLSIHTPDSECFGENITKITDDLFDVQSTESNYKSILKKMSKKMMYEDILELFEGKLSFNAMVYLKNCCERREDNDTTYTDRE